MINVFQPTISEAEIAAASEVLRGGWIGRGEQTDAFEREWATYVGVPRQCVAAVSTCTAALFMTIRALELGPGDEVILPSISFIGAGNAVASSGARPRFCDVDPRTLNPSVDHVAAAVTSRTRAVIVLHYAGFPGEVAAIAEYCQQNGLTLIEDAANAQASKVDARPCGTLGDVGVWSFDHGKLVSAVDGGMVYTRNPNLRRRIVELSHLGMTRASGYDYAGADTSRWWEFDVVAPAGRSVMNDVCAAIGRTQLLRVPEFSARRAELVRQYEDHLTEVSGVQLLPPAPDGHRVTNYLYPVHLPATVRDDVADSLLSDGIYTTFRYLPLHKLRLFRHRGPLPGAESAAATTLCLPLHHALKDSEVDYISNRLATSLEFHTGRADARKGSTQRPRR